MLVVLLIMSIVLAMTMPIISKRAKYKAASAAGAVTLTIANEGDACTLPTDGSITNNLAISTDHTTLLTCRPTATLGGSCTTGTKATQVVGGVLTQMVCQ